jgi:transposase
VSELIDTLDLRPFYAPYQGDGRRNSPYDPRMMLKVLVYGYLTGTFSSRQIQKRVVEDIGMRYLAGENGPKYRALAEFRVRHLLAFGSLLAQVIGIAQELKLIRNSRVAIDGKR